MYTGGALMIPTKRPLAGTKKWGERRRIKVHRPRWYRPLHRSPVAGHRGRFARCCSVIDWLKLSTTRHYVTTIAIYWVKKCRITLTMHGFRLLSELNWCQSCVLLQYYNTTEKARPFCPLVCLFFFLTTDQVSSIALLCESWVICSPSLLLVRIPNQYT